MLRHVIASSLALVGLIVVGITLWVPPARVAHAQDNPEPATLDQRLVASAAGFFFTFKPADVSADPLVKAVNPHLTQDFEREIGVSFSDVARITFAVLPGGEVTLVRTRKAYDTEKARAPIDRYGGRFGDKDKVFKDKDGGPEKMALAEKKVNGKVIYYPGRGRLDRWTRGWCALDKTTFAVGSAQALERLVGTKSKASTEMLKAMSKADSHSLVLALDGKKFRAMIKSEFEHRHDGFEGPQEKGEEKKADQVEEEGDIDALFSERSAALFMLPYKPLLKSKAALLTLDLGKTYKATASVTVDKADMEDAEMAAKTLLYVAGEMAVVLPKDRWNHELRGMKSLSEPVKKAFRSATLVKKDNTLSTSVSYTPDAGLLKKVETDIAEERKNRDVDKGKKFDFKDKK